jgi:hypothetical protein
MQSRFIPLAAAAALLATLACNTATDPTTVSTAARPSFANDKHLTPGTPLTAGCRGQTTAYLAQFGKNFPPEDIARFRGLGGLAGAAEVSVQDIHDIVETFCSTPE